MRRLNPSLTRYWTGIKQTTWKSTAKYAYQVRKACRGDGGRYPLARNNRRRRLRAALKPSRQLNCKASPPAGFPALGRARTQLTPLRLPAPRLQDGPRVSPRGKPSNGYNASGQGFPWNHWGTNQPDNADAGRCIASDKTMAFYRYDPSDMKTRVQVKRVGWLPAFRLRLVRGSQRGGVRAQGPREAGQWCRLRAGRVAASQQPALTPARCCAAGHRYDQQRVRLGRHLLRREPAHHLRLVACVAQRWRCPS